MWTSNDQMALNETVGAVLRAAMFMSIFAAVSTVASVAAALECDIDLSTKRSIINSSRACGFKTTNLGVGRKVPVPKKVAIGAFQVRYDFATKEYGRVIETTYVKIDDTRRNRVEFEHDVYQKITDSMYDMFVATLVDDGYEVVPPDEVIAAPSYAKVRADSSAMENKEMVRMSARGLKNVSGTDGAVGSIAAANKLAGLNKDLGTDAVIVVFSTIGLQKLSQSGFFKRAKKGGDAGVRVCLGTQDPEAGRKAGSPFEMGVLVGTKESTRKSGKAIYRPEAQATVTFENKSSICQSSEIQKRTSSRWSWANLYETSLDNYVESAVSTFGFASEIGLLQFDAVAHETGTLRRARDSQKE